MTGRSSIFWYLQTAKMRGVLIHQTKAVVTCLYLTHYRAKQANIDMMRLTDRFNFRERDWFSEWWRVVRTRTFYFAKLYVSLAPPLRCHYCLRRYVCSPALTVDILWLIQSILLNLLVVAVCVNLWTSNYVICAVAADGDNVFEA